MKIKYFYLTIVTIAVLFLTASAFMNSISSTEIHRKSNKEILKFSHQKHSDATECDNCHFKASEATDLSSSLLPNKQVCAGCHDVEDQKNCNMCHYDGVFEKLSLSKKKLVFNHKFHVSDQKQLCIKCHEGLAKVDYSFQSANFMPAMEKCYTCHNQNTSASIQCETCHISTSNLKPQDHKTVSFFDKHNVSASKADANCAMCHNNEFCEACHTTTTGQSVANSKNSFYTPYSTYKLSDGGKLQKLTRIHDLNYRYSHAIDARSKMTECRTCHETERFCGECHSANGGDYALANTTPLNHFDANFKTFGVGTGGGLHATLAKRDMESCSSCHDSQGADPVCIMCHVDNDGIKGTNPKTHKTGFRKDSGEGDWHSDRGSICYTCHTDVSAKPKPDGKAGIGFCGYCHGSNK